MSASPDSQTRCPSCGAALKVSNLATTWCDACDWNLIPHKAPPPPRSFEALVLKLNERYASALRDSVIGRDKMRPGLDGQTGAAIAVAIAAHVLAVGTFLIVAVLIVRFWPLFFPVAAGLFLCGVSVWQVIEIRRKPKDRLKRSEYPVLFGLLDSISEALKARKVESVTVSPWFDTSIGERGFPPGLHLTMGYPWLYQLTGQEMVALMAHEIAHTRNGDLTRGGVTGNALRMIVRFAWVIRPTAVVTLQGLAGAISIPFNLLLFAVSETCIGLARFYYTLLRGSSQRAEYYADRLGARLSGSAAMISLLQKVYLENMAHSAAQRIALGGTPRGYLDEVQWWIERASPRERERQLRATMIESATVDTRHPPTRYRIEALQALPPSMPDLIWADVDQARLLAELRKLEPTVEQAAVDAYRESIGS